MRRLTHYALVAAIVVAAAPDLAAASARSSYESALARERTLRAAATRGSGPTIADFRSVIGAYRAIVRRYPASGYSDNALWQAARLSEDAYARFQDERDHRLAASLLSTLISEYPSSSLVPQARGRLARIGTGSGSPADSTPAAPTVTGAGGRTASVRLAGPAEPAPTLRTVSRSIPGLATLRVIRRTVLPDLVRVTLEFDSETMYSQDQLTNPSRVFLDLRATRTDASLADSLLTWDSDAVRQIRLGRHPNNTTRVVVDLDGVARYSVFTLYNPFRVVIDCERPQDLARITPPPAEPILVAAPVDVAAFSIPANVEGVHSLPGPEPVPVQAVAAASMVRATIAPAATGPAPVEAPTMTATTPSNPKGPAPAAPSANLQGGFSLARQLGLGISRIVIDAGHGGHDPGAQTKGLSEADLVLDVALRLEKQLLKHPGVEVVMTRRSDEFVPLEERTAIANRASADLFLSIHANASRNERVHGVETYFLNFASNPDAEAVAARENSASGGSMNSLPDIVKAIALNNKLDESRDFATRVQQSMVSRLRVPNKQLRDLGVKQAPFVVLIGAAMPSVLAEISFVTNKQEAQFLKSGAYRQRIADALLLGITNYQLSLKRVPTVAGGNTQGGRE